MIYRYRIISCVVFIILTLLVFISCNNKDITDSTSAIKETTDTQKSTNAFESTTDTKKVVNTKNLSDENVTVTYPDQSDKIKIANMGSDFSQEMNISPQPWTLIGMNREAELSDDFVLKTAIQAYNLSLTANVGFPTNSNGVYVHIDSVQYMLNIQFDNPPDINDYAFGSKYRSNENYRDYILIPEAEKSTGHKNKSINHCEFIYYDGDTNLLKCMISYTYENRELNYKTLYSLTPIILNEKYYYHLNKIEDEIPTNSTPEQTTDTITDYRDWEKLGLGRDDVRYQYIKAFVNRDTHTLEHYCDLSNGVYDSYKTIVLGDYKIERIDSLNIYGSGDYIIFSFNILSSENEALNLGYHSYFLDYGLGFRLIDYPIVTPNPNTSPAESVSVIVDMHSTEIPDFENYNAKYITNYILRRLYSTKKETSATEPVLKEYAKKYLGLENFTPEGQKYQDKFYQTGGAFVLFYRIESEETASGITCVKVQFFADYSKTVKSKLVEFYLEYLDGDYKPLYSVTIEDTGYESARITT